MERKNLQKSNKLGFFARLRDRRGQSTTEYILILLVVVMVARQFGGAFRDIMNTLSGRVNTKLSDDFWNQ
jgi:hypothetical protein